MTKQNVFLTAEWRNLLMLNYEVDPSSLKSRIPAGVELDDWQGKYYISVVGFLFFNTKIKGVPIPFHTNFEELNLRFYVKRLRNNKWERGVVFIKEIVPKAAIALIARKIYNENYICHPMRHTFIKDDKQFEIAYSWKAYNKWNTISAQLDASPQTLKMNSMEEFITEHYYGYAAQKNGSTIEYEVRHPPWDLWKVLNIQIDVDFSAHYGKDLGYYLSKQPHSKLAAIGSKISVGFGKRIIIR